MKLVSYTETDSKGLTWARKVYIGDSDDADDPNALAAGVPFLKDLDTGSFDVDVLHNLLNNFLVGFNINTYEQWVGMDANHKQRLGIVIAHQICGSIIKETL